LTTQGRGEHHDSSAGNYRSEAQLECGMTPGGVALCNWQLHFGATSLMWQYCDVAEALDYLCVSNVITEDFIGGRLPRQGTIEPSTGNVTWDGVRYVPSSP
jgi:hypothetical protein